MELKKYDDILKKIKENSQKKINEIEKKYNQLIDLDEELTIKVKTLEALVKEPKGYPSLKKRKSISNETVYRLSCLSTYGNTYESEVTDRIKEIGWENFVNEQLELTHKNIYDLYEISTREQESRGTGVEHFRKAWYTNAIYGEEQLLQRIAQALSEFTLVSEFKPRLSKRGFALAYYHQILVDGLDGNFADLLFNVSNSAVMGEYLSYLGNRKEEATGEKPNEDYAREIMQLFSCGMIKLNSDGTPDLDNNGYKQEIYRYEDIAELSKVFTGIHQEGIDNITSSKNENYDKPVQYFEDEHDRGPKRIMDLSLPGNMNIVDEVRLVTDYLAGIHETAVRFCMHMINRFMTSTPTTNVVEDIVRVFKNTNGNIKEVVKAILLHPEMVSPTKTCNVGRIRTYAEAYIAGIRGFWNAERRIEFAFEEVMEDDIDGITVPRVMFENYTMFDRFNKYMNNGGGIYSAPDVFGILNWSHIPEELKNKDIGTPHKYIPEVHERNLTPTKLVKVLDLVTFSTVRNRNFEEQWKALVVERALREYGNQEYRSCNEVTLDMIEETVFGGAKLTPEFREQTAYQTGGTAFSANYLLHREIIGSVILSPEWLLIGGRND